MKKLYLIILTLVTFVPLSAQEQTLISADIDHGGFGGMAYQLTQVDDNMAIMIGGHGGWIINHTVYLGLAGFGMDGEFQLERDLEDQRYLNLGYGGLEVGLVVASNRLLHLTASTLLGGGGANYQQRDRDSDYRENPIVDGFYVIEPALHLVMNVTRHFRVGLGARYRHVSGVDLEGLTDNDLSGLSGSLIFKFGKF
ncbi:hypothetical protein ACFL45_09445 [Candidatus Neomarinimicrobiota bacterium]